MAASFPDACLQLKPFLRCLLNITEKSVRILKTKDIAEMHRSLCIIAHIVGLKVLESKQKTACYELSKEICSH